MKRVHRSSRGFTLIEVIVATAILQVGLLSALSLLVLSARTLTRAERTERAVAEAERVADSLVAAGDSSGGSQILGALELRWEADSIGLLLRVAAPDVPSFELVVPGSPARVR